MFSPGSVVLLECTLSKDYKLYGSCHCERVSMLVMHR